MERHDHMLAYEYPTVMEPIIELLHNAAKPDERVIWRSAFRWKDKDGILPNQYEMFDVESVAMGLGCEIVWNFNHAAIIRPKLAKEIIEAA